MVNFKKLSAQANRVKEMIDQQGGTDAVKDKALRVKDIAVGQGSLSDKAKAAADVAKERPEGAEAKPDGERAAEDSSGSGATGPAREN